MENLIAHYAEGFTLVIDLLANTLGEKSPGIAGSCAFQILLDS